MLCMFTPCSREFNPRLEQIYCSDDCRWKAKKARRRLKNTRLFRCEQCGREFWRNPDRAHKYRFCSQACVGASQRKPAEPILVKTKPEPPVKVCETCWNSFTPNRPEQRFCGRGCVPAPKHRETGPSTTIYFLRCGDRLKVGFTDQPFTQYLTWIQNRIPFEVTALKTRRGTQDEEMAFHREHKDYLCGWGGREWYFDTPEFRQCAEEFLQLPVDVNLD